MLVILKILGILIAAVLGIFVLLFCTVLFHAVRYQARASYWGDLESLRANVSISWLLGLLKFEIKAEGKEYNWKIKLFWKKMHGKSEPAMEDSWNQEKTEEEKNSVSEEKTGESVKAEKIREETTGKVSETKKRVRNEQQEDEPEEKSSRKKSSFADRLSAWKEKIAYTFRTICDKIRIMNQKKEMIVKFISCDVHKNAWEKGKKELSWLLKKMKPDRIKSSILFGFEDPYHTGQALAFLSILYPFMGEDMHITPDFEQRILRGSLYMKGKIRFSWFVKVIWDLFWSKDVRTTYKHIRHIGKKLVGGKEHGGEQQ